MSVKPEYLHMYFSFENAMKFLESLKIKLSSPSNFNDPFEFLPRMKNTGQLLLGTHQDIKEVSTNAIIDPFYDPVSKLSEHVKSSMNRKAYKKIEEYTNRYRIACFSEENNNILLWSHYGDKHRGVVITFKNAFEYFENNILKVEYSDLRIKIPFLDFILPDKENIVHKNWERNILITKSDCWKYEKEWRLIKTKENCLEENGMSFYPIVKECISSITLGCCISEENKRTLKEYMNNHSLGHIYLQQCVPLDNNFRLTTVITKM